MSNYFTTTWDFGTSTELDGVFIYNKAPSQPAGSFMERTRKLGTEEAVYSKLKPHPFLKHVKQGAGNHMIMKGAVKQIYTWTEEENITQKQLDQFWNYMRSNSVGINVSLVESNAVARRLVIEASFENDSNSWLSYPLPYVLDTTTSRMEVTQTGTDLICYVFSDNDPDSWTKEHCNIAPGETFKVNKEGNEYCYVIFGEDVHKGTQVLEALKPYRITSNSIRVTNKTGNSCKIFRVYK